MTLFQDDFVLGDLLKPTSLADEKAAQLLSMTSMADSADFMSNGLLDLDASLDSSDASFTHLSFLNSTTLATPTETPDLSFDNSESQGSIPEISDLLWKGAKTVTKSPTEADTAEDSRRGEYLPVRAVRYDGKPVYLRRKIKRLPTNSAEAARTIQMLDQPIHKLKQQLSAEATKLITTNITAERHNVNSTVSRTTVTQETLWVEKYRPKRFTDLLGNERVAREMMAWVKQWDYCVFGRKAPKGKRKADDDQNMYNKDDEYQRPREKILLLSGPPGLGKTSMAHVIAKQAGYDVMEINASDSRSAAVIDERIRPALESGSAIRSSKPCLIIIDEIDGATGGNENTSGFIHKLVSLTYDKSKKKGAKENRNGRPPLLRPIICICNDINAQSLSKLRTHSRQIRISRPSDIHIVKRLREVCVQETIKCEPRALSTLVGMARGDLRGCLNTLQFIKARNESVSEQIVRAATAGMKESENSVTSILNAVFAPMPRKRVKELGLTDTEESKYVTRISRDVETGNNLSSIATGCFAEYMNRKKHDANFSRFEMAGDWLATYDNFSSAMYSEGDFGILGYLSYFLVPFHGLFQEQGAPRVERDQTDWEMMNASKVNDDIYKSLAQCLRTASIKSGAYRHLHNDQVLKLEFAPYINRILSPPLKPVNSHITRPEDRQLMARVVDIMVLLQLRFVQERTEDGQLAFTLDPPIDVFVTYDGKRALDIVTPRYAVRQMVAVEIDNALKLQDGELVEKTQQQSRAGKRRRPESDPGSSPVKSGDDGQSPNKKQKVEVAIDIADKPPVDFFGRLIKTPLSVLSASTTCKPTITPTFRVSYKYTEGTSAAVRRPVKVNSFL